MSYNQKILRTRFNDVGALIAVTSSCCYAQNRLTEQSINHAWYFVPSEYHGGSFVFPE